MFASRGLRSLVVFAFCIATIALTSVHPALAQWGFLCPPGSTPVAGGGGMMCMCPDGSYANYGQPCGNYTPPDPCGGRQYCSVDNLCCNPGFYCSRYGCIPENAIECGGWYCHPGQKCSRLHGRCLPHDRVDCGSYNCPEGTKCASSHRACLAEDDVDCGGYHCEGGKKCASGRSCIPKDNVDCGASSKISCRPGTKCSRDGKRCLARDGIDCGSYDCRSGQKCGSGSKCIASDAIDCGGGKSCPAGHKCIRGGAECLTSQQIADREAAEKRRVEEEREAARRKKEEEIAAQKRAEEERKAAARRAEEERREAARRKEQERQQEIARKKKEEERRQVDEARREAEKREAAQKVEEEKREQARRKEEERRREEAKRQEELKRKQEERREAERRTEQENAAVAQRKREEERQAALHKKEGQGKSAKIEEEKKAQARAHEEEEKRKASLKQALEQKLAKAKEQAQKEKHEKDEEVRKRLLREKLEEKLKLSHESGGEFAARVTAERGRMKSDLKKLDSLEQEVKRHPATAQEQASIQKVKDHIAQTLRDVDQKDKYIAQQKIITDLTLKAQVVQITQEEISVGGLKAAALLVPITGEYVGAVYAGKAVTLTYVAGKAAVTQLVEQGLDKVLESKGFIPNEASQPFLLRMTLPVLGYGVGEAIPKGGELVGYPLQVFIEHEYLARKKP